MYLLERYSAPLRSDLLSEAMTNMRHRLLESWPLTIVAWLIATVFACAAVLSWFLLVPNLPHIAKVLGQYRVIFNASNEFWILLSATVIFVIPPALRLWATSRRSTPAIRRLIAWGTGLVLGIILLVSTVLPIFCHTETQTGSHYHCDTWPEYEGHRSE